MERYQDVVSMKMFIFLMDFGQKEEQDKQEAQTKILKDCKVEKEINPFRLNHQSGHRQKKGLALRSLLD